MVWSAEDDERLLAQLREPDRGEVPVLQRAVDEPAQLRAVRAHRDRDLRRRRRGLRQGRRVVHRELHIRRLHQRLGRGADPASSKPTTPANPYGEEFVHLREMGRDQAHGETNIDNFAAMARFLNVQGTKVDPVDGTVSTADDAVTAYEFLDNRLLEGADAFFGFMMGEHTPYTGERGGRRRSPRPTAAGCSTRSTRCTTSTSTSPASTWRPRPPGSPSSTSAWTARSTNYGTGVNSVWAAGDKSIEYWVAFPPELAGTEPTPVEDTAVTFGHYGHPARRGHRDRHRGRHAPSLAPPRTRTAPSASSTA